MSPHQLPPRITACADGPLLVRGDIEIVGDDGRVSNHSRRTVALCRCGASAIKPWCDGTHKLTRFTTGDHHADAAAPDENRGSPRERSGQSQRSPGGCLPERAGLK